MASSGNHYADDVAKFLLDGRGAATWEDFFQRISAKKSYRGAAIFFYSRHCGAKFHGQDCQAVSSTLQRKHFRPLRVRLGSDNVRLASDPGVGGSHSCH